MTSSIMHSCDESDDSLRITSVEVEVEDLGENRRPVASHWQTLSHNVVHLVPIDLNVPVAGYSWIAVVRIQFDTNVIIIVIWEKHCLWDKFTSN